MPSSPVASLLTELCTRVDTAWAAAEHAPGAFPAIAAEALAAVAAHERLDLGSVIDWLAEVEPLPAQDLGSGFGEPPLTLHAEPRWGVQLLSWVDGRTSIHEHDFSGAFAVVRGSSIQRRYAFESEHPRGAPLRLGVLQPRDAEVLELGAVRAIERGPSLIHSVYHLDRPTLSLVVRTPGEDVDGPQYDYWAPAVAIDPHHIDPRSVRLVQLLGARLRCGDPGWTELGARLLARDDLHLAFRVLDQVVGMQNGATPPAELLDAAHRAHGEVAIARILASIGQGRWDHGVGLRRAELTTPEHRFLLAALLNAARRDDVLALVARRYPEQASIEALAVWIRQLVTPTGAGQDEPVSAIVMHVIGRMLEGADLESIVPELPVVAGTHHLVDLVGDPLAFCRHVHDGPLRPLFSTG